ncbi:tyrosine-type recombinase/integrase [Nocardioides sp. AN3]
MGRKVKGKPLASRTKDHYIDLLRDYLGPTFGPLPLDEIEPVMVNLWYDNLKPRRRRPGHTGETTRAHAYALGRAIMNTATGAHGPLVGQVNPFAVRGGGSLPSKKRVELVSGSELELILATIRPEWRLLVLLGLWTGLRFSEIVELRRKDINLKQQMIVVRRSVSRSRIDGVLVKGPKSEAGNRDMHIPTALMPSLREHLDKFAPHRDHLLFAGRPDEDEDGNTVRARHLAPSTFYGKVTCSTCKRSPAQCRSRQKTAKQKHLFTPRESGWYAARAAAGHPTLHFHDLRATGATLMAQQGATEAEIQAFLGDSTPQAAQRYVRAAQSRMKQHAERMSELASSGKW